MHSDNVLDWTDEELLGLAAALASRCLHWDGHDQELFTRVSAELGRRRLAAEPLVPCLS